MVNRIYIVGLVGSGKSTLARRLARGFGLELCELDSVVYEPYAASHSWNRKRDAAMRDDMFRAAIAGERWVVEETGRACFEDAMRAADSIILLEPPIGVRRYRIVKRWIKQNLHLETCGYKPDIAMLRLMFKWTRDYTRGTDGLPERLEGYKDKVTILRSESDINMYIDRFLQ